MNKRARTAVWLALLLAWMPAFSVSGQAEDPAGAPLMLAGDDVWERYKNIRQGKSTTEDESEPPPRYDAKPVPALPAAQPVKKPAARNAQQPRGAASKPVEAAVEPAERGSWWAYFSGLMPVASQPFFGAYGMDFDWAYARRNPLEPAPRVLVMLHDTGGGLEAVQVFSPSDLGDIEVRTQDAEAVVGKLGEWWIAGSDGKPYPGRRIAAALDFLKQRYDIDYGPRGIVLEGVGMGGTGAAIQTLVLPDPWRSLIAWVSIERGILLPRAVARKQPGRFPNLPPDKGDGTTFWDGIDFRRQLASDPVVRGMHFRAIFSSDDPLAEGPRGNTQLQFVNVLEKHRVGGAFNWVKGGGGSYERGVRIPDLARFEAPEQDVSTDRAHPAITGSTGNYPATAKQRMDRKAFPRGHYNLGITWDHASIVDEPGQLVFPLRYSAHSELGKDVPDQPARITVDVTPRRARNFLLTDGEELQWSWDGGALSGSARVQGDTVTVEGLPLVSGEPYKLLRIYR